MIGIFQRKRLAVSVITTTSLMLYNGGMRQCEQSMVLQSYKQYLEILNWKPCNKNALKPADMLLAMGIFKV